MCLSRTTAPHGSCWFCGADAEAVDDTEAADDAEAVDDASSSSVDSPPEVNCSVARHLWSDSGSDIVCSSFVGCSFAGGGCSFATCSFVTCSFVIAKCVAYSFASASEPRPGTAAH